MTLPVPRLPLARRSALAAARAETDRLAAALRERTGQQRLREAAERRAVADSIVADYYRALAAIDDRPRKAGPTDPFVGLQYGIMDHCVTLLARITGKDSVRVEWNLSAGLPVDGADPLPGGTADRLAALTAPYRVRHAGTYAHLPVERGGPGHIA